MEAILQLFHNFSKKMAILQLEQEKFSMEGPQVISMIVNFLGVMDVPIIMIKVCFIKKPEIHILKYLCPKKQPRRRCFPH